MRLWFAVVALAAAGKLAAQNPRVLMDTDRGPILVELDQTRAPNTVNNFLSYVEDGTYNSTLLHRVVPNFVVQGGGFRENGAAIVRRAAIASERNNGLLNTPGTIAMALSGSPPNVNSATTDFFINTGTNASLNPNFTVFGRMVFGTKTLADINALTIIGGTEQPIRIPFVRRMARVAPGEFPILPLHTGAWFDPANSGKGFLLEVARVDGVEGNPQMLVAWYDFHEGRQIWMNGIASFPFGASSVEVPMQISTGGQFGAAFNPNQVTTNTGWGRITIRFTSCDAGTFTYTSSFGNGTVPVRSLTLPTNEACAANKVP